MKISTHAVKKTGLKENTHIIALYEHERTGLYQVPSGGLIPVANEHIVLHYPIHYNFVASEKKLDCKGQKPNNYLSSVSNGDFLLNVPIISTIAY